MLLISPAARGLGDPTHLSTSLIGQLLFWLLAATVVAIVLFWEKQTLGSLWLQPFRWQSIAWGLLFAVVHYAVLFPTGELVRRTTGLPGFTAGMEEVMRFPLWYRVLAVIGAGVVEETLFRGFTVTRLFVLTGRLGSRRHSRCSASARFMCRSGVGDTQWAVSSAAQPRWPSSCGGETCSR